MNEETIKVLTDLKSSPFESEVDHLSLLNELYWKYAEGQKVLQPIMNYYLGGIDALPTLRERETWNKEEFARIRKPFTDSHSQLIKAIDEVIEELNGTMTP